MSESLVLRGGLVLGLSGPEQTDVLIEDGFVAALGPELAGSTVLSCEGCWVGPGFVDVHRRDDMLVDAEREATRPWNVGALDRR